MKKLSFLIILEPATVFLVGEIDNTAIFPTDTGGFRTTQISPGMTYEVHRELAAKGQQPHSDTSAQQNSPYGLYTAPMFASSQRPLPLLQTSLIYTGPKKGHKESYFTCQSD